MSIASARVTFALRMLTNTQAIVLSKTKYGEGRLLLTMFTREFGTLSFAYSLPKRNSRMKTANLFQPLNILDISFMMKPERKVQTITQARFAFYAKTIPFNQYKLSISLFLSDVLRHALVHEQCSYALFSFLVDSVSFLDTTQKPFANFHIIFLVKLLSFLGIAPDASAHFANAYFDLNESVFTATPMPQNLSLPPRQAAIIPLLFRLSFPTLHLLKLSHSERNTITEIILEYYSYHLPAFPRLRSFAVLTELFA